LLSRQSRKQRGFWQQTTRDTLASRPELPTARWFANIPAHSVVSGIQRDIHPGLHRQYTQPDSMKAARETPGAKPSVTFTLDCYASLRNRRFALPRSYRDTPLPGVDAEIWGDSGALSAAGAENLPEHYERRQVMMIAEVLIEIAGKVPIAIAAHSSPWQCVVACP